MSEKTAKSLAIVLETNSDVKKLSLNCKKIFFISLSIKRNIIGTQMKKEGAMALAAAMEKNTSIKILQMACILF